MLGRRDRAMETLRDALLHPIMYVGLHAADVIHNVAKEPGALVSFLKYLATRRVRTRTNLNAIR